MDFLYENKNWLTDQLTTYKETILIFDLPGQIELYISEGSCVKMIDFIAELTD